MARLSVEILLLFPKSSSKTNEVKLMEYFMDLDKNTSTIIIEVRVFHLMT